MRAFHKNSIALMMAVMLMICAFAAGNDAAVYAQQLSQKTAGNVTLLHPEAGEFFTGSLPRTEQQSVREVSVHWQDVLGTRGTGGRLQLWVTYEPAVLQLTAKSRVRSDLKKEIPVHHSSETIVCYIHNKDGQKG